MMVCIKTRRKRGKAFYADDGNSGDFGHAGGVECEYIDTDNLSDADYAEFCWIDRKQGRDEAKAFLRRRFRRGGGQ